MPFHPMPRAARLPALLVLAFFARADSLLPPLTPQQAREAARLIASFKGNPKGPYFQIRWYCNDGSVHPPADLPCKPRGGGFQHAELSAAARQLAAWNLDLGVILVALDFEKFFDAKRDHHLLKQLVLEKYLTEVDQGWIYRRARTYRGARQAEDEEKAGRKLLIQLLSDPDWNSRHYYLANQAVAAVPHGGADPAVQKIRALAKAVADQDPRFQPIRNQIHSAPGPDDLPAVERYLRDRNPQGAARTQAEDLAGLLRRQQSGQTLEVQIGAYQKRLAGSPLGDRLAGLAPLLTGKNAAALASAAALSLEIRRAVTASKDGRRNLDLLDLNALLQEYGFRAGAGQDGVRRERLARLLDLLRYSTGAGLLSFRQLDALEKEIAGLPGEVPAETYFQSIRYLARSTGWCRATVAQDFGPAAGLYEPAEPLAGGLVDHLLRGSVALPLSARLDPLVTDANQAVGIRHSLFGLPSGRGVAAMNPGVAVGRLGIIEPGQEDAPLDPDRIYVIPATLSDLKPMSGILTLDSGNALSHAQLLAANLGIPNAVVPSSLLPTLKQYAGRQVVYAVTPRGMVVLRDMSQLTPEERRLFAEQPAVQARIDLDTTRLNLRERRILNLRDLGARDSGVTVGPKAANLAQLMQFFPDNVAPGLVLPFGIYEQHIDRALEPGAPALRRQIHDALAEAERLRDSGASTDQIRQFIYPRLARFRKAIQTMPLLPAFEQELLARMRSTFGPDGTYGVFVRSDTNAEDLPQFTGAGLNLTVPNRVGNSSILQAIKDVWASPLTERAYDWRARILRSQKQVYPSVIVMRAVPSDKSGVIATINLETGARDEITVNVSEGVSAVVDGGVAESLLLKPDGEVRLLEQARNPYRKVLLPAGGMENRPTSGSDRVLTDDEIRQVRALVAQVEARYPKATTENGQTLPWDIEFGFEKGQLRLFQIRPLVRSRAGRALEVFSRLESHVPAVERVRLDQGL